MKQAIDDLIRFGFYCNECGKIEDDYKDMREHVRKMHNDLVTDSARHKQAKEALQEARKQ